MNAPANSLSDGVGIDTENAPLFGDMDVVFKACIKEYSDAEAKHKKPHYLTRRFAILGVLYSVFSAIYLAVFSIYGQDVLNASVYVFSLLAAVSGIYFINLGDEFLPHALCHWVFQAVIITSSPHFIGIELAYSIALFSLCWLSNIKFGYTRSWSRNRSMAGKVRNLYALYKCNAYEEIDIRQMLIKLVNDNIDQNHNDIVNDYALFGDRLTSLAKIRK